MSGIEFEGVPLRAPVLVGAFEGWNDAGDAASDAIAHLAGAWDASPLAAIDPEDYYDFQVNRPVVTLVDGVTRRIQWPTTRFDVCRLPDAERDVVLLRGIEPNMRWRSFCEEVLEIAEQLGIGLVVMLGALLADTPHTRPIPVTGSASDAALGARLGLQRSRYEGPTGIVGVLHDACHRRTLPAASLWAAVPHYYAQAPSPKATLALLRRIEDILDVPVPLGDLEEAARAWERGAHEFVTEDGELVDYVRQLEERESETELPEASGEAIAREFERFLRRGDSTGDGDDWIDSGDGPDFGDGPD